MSFILEPLCKNEPLRFYMVYLQCISKNIIALVGAMNNRGGEWGISFRFRLILSLGFGLRERMTHVGVKFMSKVESNQSHEQVGAESQGGL